MKRAILVLAIAALALGCKRQKAPVAKRIWLGPRGGCMTTLEHPTTGTFACWGWVPPNREDAAFASKRSLPVDASASATPLDLGISDGFVCSIEAKDASDVRCYWGGGGHSERTETVPGKVVSVAGGSAGVCAAATEGVECWNISPFDPKPWARNAKVRAVAVGDHHLCAAYEGLGVRCRGVKTAGKEDVGDAARASLDQAHRSS